MGFWEGFFDSLLKMAARSWIDAIVLIAGAGLVLLLVALACYGVFIAIDSWFRPILNGPGEVIAKTHKPAETHMEDSWEITVSCKYGVGSLKVTEKYHDSVETGKRVNVKFVLGRISKWVYVKDIS